MPKRTKDEAPDAAAAPSKRVRRTFSNEQRAEALALLQANNYPEARGALEHTATITGIPQPTLAHWARGTRGSVPPELQSEKQSDLAERFRSIAEAYTQQALDTVARTSGAQAVTAAAIAVDKMRLLQGLPTAIVGLMPDALGAIKALGYEPAEFFAALIARAEEQAHYIRIGKG